MGYFSGCLAAMLKTHIIVKIADISGNSKKSFKTLEIIRI
nr:MAG TPA: hypothetical protein [Caudoviricetes sp.]